MNKKICIVVVDDDHAVRESLKFSLELEGFQVKTRASGLELLHDTDVGEVDCLVLDYKMPELDGFAVIAALADRKISIPTILITAPVTAVLLDRAKRVGIFQVLEKPLTGGVLTDSILQAACT